MTPTTMIMLSIGLLAVGLAIAVMVLLRRGRFAWHPLAYVERAHALLPEGTSVLRVFDCGHFDLYVGAAHGPNAEAQAQFLVEQLGAHA